MKKVFIPSSLESFGTVEVVFFRQTSKMFFDMCVPFEVVITFIDDSNMSATRAQPQHTDHEQQKLHVLVGV